jgi:hypothetical protein
MARTNDYDNAYAQSQPTRISQEKSLGSLIATYRSPIIKSRIAVIHGADAETAKMKYLWHKDESIFLNLRTNIPIVTSDQYAIQVINESSRKNYIRGFSMKPGHAYVYDTGKMHRAYSKKVNALTRVHLIIGIVPWFDYDAEAKAWVSNEFYGEIHPFEMFQLGLVSSCIYT